MPRLSTSSRAGWQEQIAAIVLRLHRRHLFDALRVDGTGQDVVHRDPFGRDLIGQVPRVGNDAQARTGGEHEVVLYLRDRQRQHVDDAAVAALAHQRPGMATQTHRVQEDMLMGGQELRIV